MSSCLVLHFSRDWVVRAATFTHNHSYNKFETEKQALRVFIVGIYKSTKQWKWPELKKYKGSNIQNTVISPTKLVAYTVSISYTVPKINFNSFSIAVSYVTNRCRCIFPFATFLKFLLNLPRKCHIIFFWKFFPNNVTKLNKQSIFCSLDGINERLDISFFLMKNPPDVRKPEI